MSARGVAVLAAAAVTACGPIPGGDLVHVRRDDLPVTVEATGALRAVESTSISPPLIPEVWELKIAHLADDSSTVRRGEPVLAFDPTAVQQELDRKTASRDQAAKEIEKKELELRGTFLDLDRRIAEAYARLGKARLKVEVPEGLSARLELRRAQIDLGEAEAEVASAQAQRGDAEESGRAQVEILRRRRDAADVRVRQLQDGLARMSVAAPRDGLVILTENWRGEKKKVGDGVSPFDEVLEIPDLSRMEARAEIDEADGGRVAVGQPVRLRLEAHPDVEYIGRVAEIDPTVQRQSWRTPLKVYRLRVELDRTDAERMRPGMRFRAEIEVHRVRSALVIPLDAVRQRPGGPVVHLRSGGGWAAAPVALGERGGELVEVLSGLEEGQEIARAVPEEDAGPAEMAAR